MSLRIARKIAGLTQTELARRAGIDNSAISRVEAGERSLRKSDYGTVVAIAAQLNIDPDELLSFADVPDPPLRRAAEQAAARRKSRSRRNPPDVARSVASASGRA